MFSSRMRDKYSKDSLDVTHVFLREIEAVDLNDVYTQSQGEIWSPNGEAMELIKNKGLAHTSMYPGDVVYCTDNDTYYLCDSIGWKKLV